MLPYYFDFAKKTVIIVNPWSVSDVEITPIELLRYTKNIFMTQRQNLDA